MNREACLFIIESRSHNDIYSAEGEADTLADLLRSQLPCSVRHAGTCDLFLRALEEANRSLPRGRLFLHLSCHGSEDGLELTNEGFVTWAQLAEALRPLNREDRPVVLFLSSCHGLFGSKMAYDHRPVPFEYLVGYANKPTWEKTRLAAHTFYCNIGWGWGVEDAVRSARDATHDDSFTITSGASIRSQFVAPRLNSLSNQTGLRIGPSSALTPDARDAATKGAPNPADVAGTLTRPRASGARKTA